MKITLFDEQDKQPLTEEITEGIKRTLEAAAQYFGVDFCANLLVTDGEGIRRLNREFRGIDRETDVLSFPAYELSRPLAECMEEIEPELEDGLIFIGDIAVSLPRAKRQAEEYGHGIMRETAFLALHGALHLLGYDHMEPEDEEVMTAHQRNILEQVQIGRDVNGTEAGA